MIARSRQKSKPPARKDTMLSIAEASRRLGLSPRSVRREMDAGQLDWGVYPSGRRMVSGNSVDRFIQLAKEGRL